MNLTRESSKLGWLIWTLGCLFYFYENFLQVSPSVMSNELMQAFAVTGHTLGILSGVYFYSYAAMQLPCGMLMDFFGPKKILFIATAICASSAIAFGTTTHFSMACIARLMIGFGSAFAVVGTMKLASNWFSAAHFPVLTGLMVTIGMIGGICGETPQALMVDSLGWRSTMTYLGLIGLVLTVFIYFIVKDAPTNTKTKGLSSQLGVKEGLMMILKNKQLWLIASYGGLIYMCTPVFCGLWGVPFLMLKLGIDKPSAANAVSLVFVGWAIASPLWGIYTNYLGRRKPSLYISAIGTLMSLLAIIYLNLSLIKIELLLFIFGVVSAAFLPAFSIARDMCHDSYVATGLSFMNMMNMIGIAVAQPLIGCFLDLLWSGEIDAGIRIYSLSAYQSSLFLLPLAIGVALCLLPLIQESKAKA